MLSTAVTDLLSIDYKGLFDDQSHCFSLLTQKRASGDPNTPPELLVGALFDLSPDLFIWVAQQHLDNNSAHLVAKDVMSNISTAGLSGSYGTIVDMLAAAGHAHRAAQIWRADVASHIDVFREFLRARKTVDKYTAMAESQPQKPAAKAAPDRFQRGMAKDFPDKKQMAHDAVDAFENWASQYGVTDQHSAQIALWKKELESGQKPKIPQADKTPMSQDLFWEIIAKAKSGSQSETILKIEDQMATYTAKAIRDAGKIVQSYQVAAYREDVWALAYLLQDGCSDDGFEDFRCWMILQGRAAFDQIIQSPDTFDPKHAEGADFGAAGSLLAAFENAYLSRSGKPLILPRAKHPQLNPDENSFADLLPSLAAKLANT